MNKTKATKTAAAVAVGTSLIVIGVIVFVGAFAGLIAWGALALAFPTLGITFTQTWIVCTAATILLSIFTE